MAKALLSPIASEIKGSIGGLTFRNSAGETSITTRSIGPSNAGAASTQQQQFLKIALQAWNTLPPRNKQAWLEYHKTGNEKHPWTGKKFQSARDMFTFFQIARQHCAVNLLINKLITPLYRATLIPNGYLYSLDTNTHGYITATDHIDAGTELCIFASLVRKGAAGPSKWVRKIFPLNGDTPGIIANFTDRRIWQRFGYPRGLNGLVTQTQPDTVECWVRCYSRTTDRLNFSQWAKLTNWPTFIYPPPSP